MPCCCGICEDLYHHYLPFFSLHIGTASNISIIASLALMLASVTITQVVHDGECTGTAIHTLQLERAERFGMCWIFFFRKLLSNCCVLISEIKWLIGRKVGVFFKSLKARNIQCLLLWPFCYTIICSLWVVFLF